MRRGQLISLSAQGMRVQELSATLHLNEEHASVVLTFLKTIRRRYDKGRRIYLVLDNLSTYTTLPIRQCCQRHQVTLVFTAINASWMNLL